jgi:hypothetical protein
LLAGMRALMRSSTAVRSISILYRAHQGLGEFDAGQDALHLAGVGDDLLKILVTIFPMVFA